MSTGFFLYITIIEIVSTASATIRVQTVEFASIIGQSTAAIEKMNATPTELNEEQQHISVYIDDTYEEAIQIRN